MNYPPILHVEDEDASAYLLQAALEQAAILNRTYRVCSGENALAYLLQLGDYREAQSPALVILDLKLPQVDGWSVLSMMKKQTSLQSIPVVILSALNSDAEKQRARTMGANQYLVKQSSVHSMKKALMETCAELMSFQTRPDRPQTHIVQTACIAFERLRDGGTEINVAAVLPEGAEVKLLLTDVARSVAQIRYEGRLLWLSLEDLRDYTISAVTRPNSPAVPFP